MPEMIVHIASPCCIAIAARGNTILDSMMWAVSPSGASASVVDPRADDLSASTIAATVAPDIDRFEDRQPTPRGVIGGS